MKLDGKVALVTGASRGLGLAIAEALTAESASVALLARPGDELGRAVERLGRDGARVTAAPADVTSSSAVDQAVRGVIERWGRLDILVLNAGTWQGAPIAETSDAMWDQIIDLNLKGAFLALRAAIPALIERHGATVVGIDSLGGWAGQPGSAAYAASKWGLRGLLESAALEHKPQRVRDSIVSPHNINSAGRPIEPGSEERDRNLEPQEIASLVAWIAAAPDHVSVGNVTIWPLAAGIRGR
ncbi:MAG TPA: SDR family oxidoreductase [Candidatus Udaeobacter sp.]|nr:SDR family oxidoreductase [Candidatus Udaeobacter sp.]